MKSKRFKIGDIVMVGAYCAKVVDLWVYEGESGCDVEPLFFSSIRREVPNNWPRHATVSDVVKEFYLARGNALCCLDVFTSSIADELGSYYDGKRVQWGGVSGRVSDIPAYVGAYPVLSAEITELLGKDRLIITI